MTTPASQPRKNGKQPVKVPQILTKRTQEVLRKLEAKLGAPIVTYWNSPNGAICANDVIGLYGILRSIGKQEHLYLFVKSDGGNGQSSLRMVNLLRQYVRR